MGNTPFHLDKIFFFIIMEISIQSHVLTFNMETFGHLTNRVHAISHYSPVPIRSNTARDRLATFSLFWCLISVQKVDSMDGIDKLSNITQLWEILKTKQALFNMFNSTMKTHLSNFKVQRDPKYCLTVNSIYFTRIHTTFEKTPILHFFQTVYFLYTSLPVVQILFPKVMSQFISFPRSCNSPRIAASNSSPKKLRRLQYHPYEIN